MDQLDRFKVITDFLLEGVPDVESIDGDFDLIESRLLDSLRFVRFIHLLEEHSGRSIPFDCITAEDFRTLNRIKERYFDER